LASDVAISELHAFAAFLGLRREWYQDKRIPHYDLTSEALRKKALRGGAMLVSSKDIVTKAVRA
jgi:hypothetical protein